ncbi:MAG: hypothetical protein P8X57_11470, partial [Cyclobacteriaceae bacterium]
VKNGETGILLDKEISPQKAALAVNDLIGNTRLRNRLVKNAFGLVKSKYDISLQLERLESIYNGD